MSIWDEPSPSDWDRWETLIFEEGSTPSDAAKLLGFGGSSTFKRSDPAQHAKVLERWRQDRDETDRQTARETFREVITRSLQGEPVTDREGNETGEWRFDTTGALRGAELLHKAAGGFTERVELSGPNGGAMEVNSPDVTAAIDRFRESLESAVVREAARQRAAETARAALPPGASEPRVRMGELARPTKPATP